MTEQKKVGHIMLPIGRFSFPKIAEKQYGPDDKAKKHGKYNFNVIIAAAGDLSQLTALIRETAKAKWGEKAKPMAQAGKLKMPTKLGSDMVDDDGVLYNGYELDSQVVAVNFFNPMPFLNMDKTRVDSDSDLAENIFYAGCDVSVAVTAHAYDIDLEGGGKSRGVNLRCYGLMKRADNEKFGGGGIGDPDELFDSVEATEPTFAEGETAKATPDAGDGEEW